MADFRNLDIRNSNGGGRGANSDAWAVRKEPGTPSEKKPETGEL